VVLHLHRSMIFYKWLGEYLLFSNIQDIQVHHKTKHHPQSYLIHTYRSIWVCFLTTLEMAPWRAILVYKYFLNFWKYFMMALLDYVIPFLPESLQIYHNQIMSVKYTFFFHMQSNHFYGYWYIKISLLVYSTLQLIPNIKLCPENFCHLVYLQNPCS
jgi:hypothetical protein